MRPTIFILPLIFIATLTFPQKSWALLDLFANSKCEKLSWTKEDARTMGGGWVWYPGKGAGKTLEDATLRAEGRALEMLVKECAFPHKEVKVHERCAEKTTDGHRVFLRLSLLEKQCGYAKNARGGAKDRLLNKGLNRTLKRYRKLIGDDTQIVECDNLSGKKCYELGRHAYFTANKEGAFSLFDKGCQKGYGAACFNAGVVAMELGKSGKAAGLFRLAKDKGDHKALLFLGHLAMRAENKKKAMNHYKEACSKKLPKGCLALATYQGQDGLKLLAKKNYAKACDLKHGDSCHRASTFHWDNGDKATSGSFARKACDLKHGKGCFNLGFQMKKSNKKLARKSFEKSCKLGVGRACFMAVKNGAGGALKLLRQGCDAGDAESCKEASIRLYDLKKKDESLAYSKFACKLGKLKSCHNSGYLEYKKGRMDEARTFLSWACDRGVSQSCGLLSKLTR